jgi:hypothetical protein
MRSTAVLPLTVLSPGGDNPGHNLNEGTLALALHTGTGTGLHTDIRPGLTASQAGGALPLASASSLPVPSVLALAEPVPAPVPTPGGSLPRSLSGRSGNGAAGPEVEGSIQPPSRLRPLVSLASSLTANGASGQVVPPTRVRRAWLNHHQELGRVSASGQHEATVQLVARNLSSVILLQSTKDSESKASPPAALSAYQAFPQALVC